MRIANQILSEFNWQKVAYHVGIQPQFDLLAALTAWYAQIIGENGHVAAVGNVSGTVGHPNLHVRGTEPLALFELDRE